MDREFNDILWQHWKTEIRQKLLRRKTAFLCLVIFKHPNRPTILLGRPSRPLETPAFTADEFLDMLNTKTNSLRAATADATPPVFSSTSSEFDGFKRITDADLRTVFSGVNLRSCELDPLPPFIIIDLLDDLTPF